MIYCQNVIIFIFIIFHHFMYGVIQGLYRSQDRTQELNQRIYSRNIPSSTPPVHFSSRPVPTKYTTMPILDHRITPKVMVSSTQFTDKDFLPGTHGPGFSQKVDDESKLRNITYAIQRASQAVYVPSSNSDLYVYTVPPKQVEQPHPHLFKAVETTDSGIKVPYAMPPAMFNTRQAILDCPL